MYNDYDYNDMDKEFATLMCNLYGFFATSQCFPENRKENIDTYLKYWNECRRIF